MLAQLVGALLGGLAASYLFGKNDVYLTVGTHVAQCMVAEVVGAFILVMAYLTQTEPKYKLTNDAAITMLIISGAYTAAICMSPPAPIVGNPPVLLWSTSSFNPAIAFSIVVYGTFNGYIT